MRLQEHLNNMNEETSDINNVAGQMVRLIMGNKDTATAKLKRILPMKQANFYPGVEYNKAFTEMQKTIAAAIKKAFKTATK